MTTDPQPATQTRHPWRATVRTALAAAIALATLLPYVVAEAHIDAVPGVTQVLAVAAAVTRVLAIPGVNDFLKRYAPILATDPAPPRE